MMSSCTQPLNTFWDGVFATDFTLDHVRKRCRCIGNMLIDRGWSCLVAYDSRFMSDIFAQDMYHNLKRQGIPVHLTTMPVPLPAVYHALVQKKAHCAVVVSARNKPYWYNGLVVLQATATEPFVWTDDDIPTEESLPFPFNDQKSLQPDTPLRTLELRSSYLDVLRDYIDISVIHRSMMTIFVDAMHGTTAGCFPAIIGGETQSMAIEINREADPLFERSSPLPAQSHLTRLRKLVRESNSHLGLAFSADGTALSVVDKHGEPIDQVEIALLLASYLASHYRQKGLVIAPFPKVEHAITMTELRSWQNSLGITVELVANPSQHIANILMQKKMKLLVGCTPEGEIILGNIALYPDALLAGLFIVEMVARSGGSLRSLLDELRAHLSTT